METVSFVALVILAVLFGLYTVVLFLARRNIQLNAKGLNSQLTKLVVANAVDKAIKLCNAAPEAPLAKAMKKMLIQANRPHRIELYYHSGLMELDRFDNRAQGTTMVTYVLAIVSFGTMLWALHGAAGGAPIWLMGMLLAFYTLSLWMSSNLFRNIRESKVYLTEMRNTLYNLNGYAPPAYTPRKLTKEEIQQWRDSMQKVEQAMALEGVPRNKFTKEYNKRVGGDDILPPV